MSRIFVIPGHGDGDPGACANGFSEAERVRALASRIKEYGGNSVILSDFSRDAYKDQGLRYWDIPSDCAVIELHMDAAVPSAKGAHVIIKSGFNADEHDSAIADYISSILPGRSDKIVGRSNLQNVNQAAARGINYRLVEHGFISNAVDVAIFNEKIDEIAKKYCEIFGIIPAENVAKPSVPEPDGGTDFEGGAYRCTVDGLRIRKAPGLDGEICNGVWWDAGDIVYIDNWYTIVDGIVWGRYEGIESGQPRFVAIGMATGKPEDDDYLVKA